MTLLNRLYRYRASAQRSPTEDFLSEAFVEWLRLAGKAGLMGQVLEELLCLPPARGLPQGNDGSSIRWSSQHVIGPGYSGSGKRPDIVGQTDDFFLIIENKRGLGALARRELTSRASGQGWRGLSVPWGGTSGSFNEPQFFGVADTT